MVHVKKRQGRTIDSANPGSMLIPVLVFFCMMIFTYRKIQYICTWIKRHSKYNNMQQRVRTKRSSGDYNKIPCRPETISKQVENTCFPDREMNLKQENHVWRYYWFDARKPVPVVSLDIGKTGKAMRMDNSCCFFITLETCLWIVSAIYFKEQGESRDIR